MRIGLELLRDEHCIRTPKRILSDFKRILIMAEATVAFLFRFPGTCQLPRLVDCPLVRFSTSQVIVPERHAGIHERRPACAFEMSGPRDGSSEGSLP